jgi:hypothetical protein
MDPCIPLRDLKARTGYSSQVMRTVATLNKIPLVWIQRTFFGIQESRVPDLIKALDHYKALEKSTPRLRPTWAPNTVSIT